MPATKLAHGHVVFDKLSYEETAIGNYNFDCAGFIADCSFKEGVRFELTFEGYTFNKPVYLLMSLWGEGGLHFYETYFGVRRLSVFLDNRDEPYVFEQKIWNESGYVDLNSLVVFNFSDRTIHIAKMASGFTAIAPKMRQKSWVIKF